MSHIFNSRTLFTFLTLFVLTLSIVISLVPLTISAASNDTPLPPTYGPVLTVSPDNKHYFRLDGKPFYWVGDTGWLMATDNMTTAQITEYLQDRHAKGVRVIQGPIFGPYVPPYDGGAEDPFINGTPLRLNNSWWAKVDHAIKEAGRLGMVIIPALIWGPENDRVFTDPVKHAEYAALVAKRYANQAHVVWIPAGEFHKIKYIHKEDGTRIIPNDEFDLNSDEIARYNLVTTAIRANAHPSSLIVYHPNYWQQPSRYFGSDARVAFNMLQSSGSIQENLRIVPLERASTLTKPVVEAEVGYEDTVDNLPWKQRVQAYHTLMQGGAGFTYGHGLIWKFAAGWQSAMQAEGGVDVLTHYRTFAQSIHSESNVPAQSSVIGAGNNSNTNHSYVTALKSGDNKKLYAFVPNGRTFNLNVQGMAMGNLVAKWYDPRNGVYTAPFPVTRSANVSFDPPGAVTVDGNDWALAIEVAGSTPTPTPIPTPIPTPTPTPTPTPVPVPTPTPTPIPVPSSTKFKMGDTIEANTPGDVLRVRDANNSFVQISTQPHLSVGVISENTPKYFYNLATGETYTMWNVNFRSGVDGWVAEPWIRINVPAPTPTPVPTPTPTPVPVPTPQLPTTPSPTCTIPAQAGRTIVNLDTMLLSSNGKASISEDFKVDLPAGTYDITLMSYDSYANRVDVSQPNESFLVRLSGKDYKLSTKPTTDLEDKVKTVGKTEVVNINLVISKPITTVNAVHAVYPDKSSANSVRAVCAAFDLKVGTQPVPSSQPPSTTCHLLSKDSVVSSSFSVPHDFTTNQTNITISCPTNTEAEVTVGTPGSGLFIGTNLYYREQGDTSLPLALPMSGTKKTVTNSYLDSIGKATIKTEPGTTYEVRANICRLDGAGYKCNCKNASCSERGVLTLQLFKAPTTSVAPSPSVTVPTSGKFKVGDTVKVVIGDGELNVRELGLNWTHKGTQSDGASGTITSNRTEKYVARDGKVYAMWQVAFNSGVSGFVAEDYLFLQTASVPTTKPATITLTNPGTWCANENNVCSFTGTRTVRYGYDKTFVEKVLTGPISCSNATFGDPLKYVYKACYLAPDNTASPLTTTGWYLQGWKLADKDEEAPTIPGRTPDLILKNQPSLNYAVTRTKEAFSGLGLDNYAIRAERKYNLEAGNYKMKVGADDGVRVFINNQQIFEVWKDQSLKEQDVTFTVTTTGEVIIKVEHYENKWYAGLTIGEPQKTTKTTVTMPVVTSTPDLPPTPAPVVTNTPTTLSAYAPGDGPAGKARALPAKGIAYYIDPISGSDSNDGLTPQTAWKTLEKINSIRGQLTTKDIYLKSGSIFENKTLYVDWSGTKADPAVIGAYHQSGNNYFLGLGGQSRPEINGTFEDICEKAKNCKIGQVDKNEWSAVPTNQYGALVFVIGNYVTIENLALADSAGHSLLTGPGSNSKVSAIGTIIQNNTFDHSAMSPFHIGYSKDVIARDNVGTRSNYCDKDNYSACNSTFVGWAAGMTIHDSMNANALFENNNNTQIFGEGLNCLRSSGVTFRGNRTGNTLSNGIYLDQCSDSVVESNIVWSDPEKQYHWLGTGQAGINVFLEHYPGKNSNSTNNIVRNNLVAGNNSCITLGAWEGSRKLGLKVGAEIYNNTCIGNADTVIDIFQYELSATEAIDKVVVKNNIFYSPDVQKGSCIAPTTSKVTFSHNFWSKDPGGNCKGVGDVYGDPKVQGGTPSKFKSMTHNNQPKVSDFTLGAGSQALNNGISLPENTVDFLGNRRDNTPNLGAIE